jgi:CBS domain-containing protein
MIVKDVMAKTPAFCSPETSLGAAVEIMWNRNCGILPVVDAQKQVVGVITDRDIAIALGTRNQLPAEITVADAATRQVETCKPLDDIHTALDSMAQRKVRRLVVVNEQNQLEGVLSMDDVVLNSGSRTGLKPEISADEVLRTLRTLYSPQLTGRAARAAE